MRAIRPAVMALFVSGAASGAIPWTSVVTWSPVGDFMEVMEVAGEVYILGGTGTDGGIAVFDAPAKVWNARAPFPVLGYYILEAAVVGSSVYVVGGWDSGSELANVYMYDTSTDSWAKGPATMGFTHGRRPVSIGSMIYTIGSTTYSWPATSLFQFNAATGIWAVKPGPPSKRTSDVAMVALSGKVYVLGGSGPGPEWYSSAEVYDPASNTWTSVSDAPIWVRAATSLCGKIYAVGADYTESPYGSYRMAIYDPATDKWQNATDPPGPLSFTTQISVCSMDGGLFLAGWYYLPLCCPISNTLEVATTGDLTGGLLSVESRLPPVVSAGQWVKVSATVSNDGCSGMSGVMPYAWPSPPAAVTVVAGPAPAGPVDLASRSATVFTWTFSASGSAMLFLTTSATGAVDLTLREKTATCFASMVIQWPASLSGTLSGSSSGCVGDVVTLTALVTNTGEANAKNVTPSAALAVSGTGGATKVNVSPPVSTIAGGGSWAFTWDYLLTSPGNVIFTATVTGKEGNAGWTISTGPMVSGTVVFVAPAVLEAAASGPTGPPVPVGQWLTVDLTVTNTGGIPADLIIPVIGIAPGSGPVVAKDGPSTGVTVDPGSATTFAWTYSASGWGRVAFTMSAPGTDACHALEAGKTVSVDLGTPAALDTSALTVWPDPLCEGMLGSLRLTVTNTGQVPCTGVTGVPVVVTGAGVLSPLPLPIGNLPGGSSTTLTWTFTATSVGTLAFSVTVAGTDARSLGAVSAAPVGSNAITVTPRAFLAASACAGLSGTLLSGTWVTVMLTVTNTGANGATGVSPRWVQTGGSGVAVYATGPSPAGPVSLTPGTETTFTWTLSVSGSGVVNLLLSATGFSCAAQVMGSAPVSLLVRRPAVLAIDSLTLSPGSVVAGATVYASLVVRNAGDVPLTVTAAGRTVTGLLVPSVDALTLPVGLGPGLTTTFTWKHLTATVCGTGSAGASVGGWEDLTGRPLSALGTSNTVNLTGTAAWLGLAASAAQANISTAVGLVATVRDTCGNGVAGENVSFGVLTGGGWVSAMNAMTDGAGEARVSWTLGSWPGPNGAEAELAAQGLSGMVTVEGVNPLGLAEPGAGLSTNVINVEQGQSVIARIRPLDGGPVEVKIYTASGRLLRTLTRLEAMGPGEWRVTWDGMTEGGRPVARGVYIVLVMGGGLNERLKVVVR